MDRNPDGPRLIRDGPRNRLPNPPSGVGAEFVAALVFEFIHGLHQPNVPLLDQIEEGESPVGVLFRDADHEPKVRFGQLFPRPPILAASPANHLEGLFQILVGGAGLFFRLPDSPADIFNSPVVFGQDAYRNPFLANWRRARSPFDDILQGGLEPSLIHSHLLEIALDFFSVLDNRLDNGLDPISNLVHLLRLKVHLPNQSDDFLLNLFNRGGLGIFRALFLE